MIYMNLTEICKILGVSGSQINRIQIKTGILFRKCVGKGYECEFNNKDLEIFRRVLMLRDFGLSFKKIKNIYDAEMIINERFFNEILKPGLCGICVNELLIINDGGYSHCDKEELISREYYDSCFILKKYKDYLKNAFSVYKKETEKRISIMEDILSPGIIF